MHKIIKFLLGLVAFGSVLTASATPISVRVNNYWMVYIDLDDKEHTIFKHFQTRADEYGFTIVENWASMPEVVNVNVDSFQIPAESKPELAGDYVISEIADYAFQCDANPNVNPERYEFINYIKTISLPATIETIGNMAFQNCGSLTSVNIPESVTSLGYSAFENCKSLVNVDFRGKPAYGILPATTFRNCTALEEIVLPESITILGSKCFEGCTSLKRIVFKSRSLNTMASDAFDGIDMSGVTVVVPKGCKGNFAALSDLGAMIETDGIEPEVGRTFEIDGVTYLTTSINPLEVSVKKFTPKTFAGPVTVSAKVSFDGDLYAVTAISDYAFEICSGITSVTLPEGVREIGGSAFSRCSALTEISFPSTLRSIGSAAFENTALTALTIPAGVTTLSPGAFQNCPTLESIVIDANISVLNNWMFRNCPNLTTITLPASLTYMGNEVFAGCGALRDLIFRGSTVGITGETLNGLGNIGSVEITIPSASCLGGYDALKDLVLCVKTPDGRVIYNRNGIVEYTYAPTATVKTADGLEDGAVYFINVSRRGDRTKQGYLIGQNRESNFALYAGSYMSEMPISGCDNLSYLWRVIKTELPDSEGFHFKLRNMAEPGRCFSKMGARGEAWQNAKSVAGPDDSNVGIYHLEVPAGCDNFGDEDHPRFWMRLSNGKWSNSNTGSPEVSPCLMSNGGSAEETVGYWDYDTSGNFINYLQLEFQKAEEVQNVAVTLVFPAMNGAEMTYRSNAAVGQSAANLLSAAIESFGCGDFEMTAIAGADGSDIISAYNTEFTVSGRWVRQLLTDRVYRLCIDPADSPSALRYMLSTGEIETKREGAETLNRLVPERLWFFTEADDCLTMHTLHLPADGVCFAAAQAGERATLGADATRFTLLPKTNGDVALKLADGDLFVADNNHSGFMALSETNDAAATIRLYELTADDFNALAAFASDEALAAAKADPSPANVLPLVEAFNARNLEAALKRIDYIQGEGRIGNNPGQYGDESGEFAAKVEYARQIAAKGSEATDEEIENAIAGIDISDFDVATLNVYHTMEPGVFYRFRNRQSNSYLSSLAGAVATGHQTSVLTDDATRSNTVFYALANNEADNADEVEYTVVCFDDGLVLPQFTSSTGESWLPTLGSSTTAAHAIRFVDQNNGCFIIHTSGTGSTHRHLHGGGNIAGAGSGADNGYQWYIERVAELPLTLYNVVNIKGYPDNDGWASVYSPVALEIPAASHLTAYTGIFDGTDYTDRDDINHVAVTPIPADADGKVIIPANVAALLFFDGDDQADTFGSQIESRADITYINVPVVYDFSGEATDTGNLSGGIMAVSPADGKEYYTLHASHSNNFREYSEYRDNYTFIPGFKAYIETDPDTIAAYPIYLMNPNSMLPADGDEGFDIQPAEEEGMFKVTVVTPDENFTVYHRHSLTAGPENIRRVADSEPEFEVAAKLGSQHSFTVPAGSRVEYYAEHSEGHRSVVRHFTVNADGSVGLQTILASPADATPRYDILGRRLTHPLRGLNILPNKKLLIKR